MDEQRIELRDRPEVGLTPHVNVLLYGPGKSGKTTGALSAPGGKFMLNFDMPNSTYFARTFKDPEGEIMEPVVPDWAEGQPVTERFLNLVTLEVRRQAEMPEAERHIHTLIADPIGQLHRRLLEDVSRRALKPPFDHYNHVSKLIARWCRAMCKLPINFVVVCHERPSKDEGSGEVERLPFTGTSNPDLGLALIEMVDVVAFTGMVQRQDGPPVYVGQLFNGNGRRGGDRFGVLATAENGGFRELNLREWFETIGNPLVEPAGIGNQKSAAAEKELVTV